VTQRDERASARAGARTWIVVQAALWLLVGAGTTLLIEKPRERRPALADAVDQAAERLRRLELTEAQRGSLETIRRDWRETVLVEEKGYVDRLFAAAVSADTKIQELLTDAQRAKYRDLSLPPAPK
jgi:hypothetical protein